MKRFREPKFIKSIVFDTVKNTLLSLKIAAMPLGKQLFATTIFLLLIGCSSTQQAALEYTPIEYFKNYALCTCIADGYRSQEVVKDAAAGARGYLELGAVPLEAHTEATKIGRTFLAKEYKSISGEKLVLMKCIDFYHSQELDSLAKQYQKEQ